MTTDQLEIPGAAEGTLRVELATIRVEGRRLTRALYNQLREEVLIAKDGTLNGTPWGYVNEHSKDRRCGRFRGRDAEGYYTSDMWDRAHRHVIWQRGGDLLRDVVLSLDAAERQCDRFGPNLDLDRVWNQLPPHTIPARRRSYNLIAGLPQLYIGR